jgi:hypothetical protein
MTCQRRPALNPTQIVVSLRAGLNALESLTVSYARSVPTLSMVL